MRSSTRRAIVIVGLAVAAAALAAPAGAGNDSAPVQMKKPEPPSSYTTAYTATYTDLSGKVTGRKSGSGSFRMEDPGGGGGSGCTSLDIEVRSSTVLGRTAYVFHQVKRWCWSHPHVTSESSGAYFSDVDPNYIVRGNWGHGWYFSWNGSGTGGHVSFRQAHVENCVFHYGCIRNEYPWVEIRAYGNGQWSASTGT